MSATSRREGWQMWAALRVLGPDTRRHISPSRTHSEALALSVRLDHWPLLWADHWWPLPNFIC